SPYSMTDDPESDPSRKRKRVPDSALADGEGSGKNPRLGVIYPEEEHLALAAAAASAASSAPRPPRASPPSMMRPGDIYALDAGAQLGGTTSFVRGGIVTELSLLAPAAQLQQQQAAAEYEDPFEDPFVRAIRRSQQVSTQATYTIQTKKISSGKGFEMLQKMNWRHGQGLGKRQQGRVEPLEVTFRADRTGL
ncbi:MAG: G patch domain-containing protein, partial [Candidatus Pacebacteria bacterium]|nr:G patch domain-containing protein [Candidatus Paceibacterota bacterium]